MKRLIPFLLVVGLVLSLGSCDVIIAILLGDEYVGGGDEDPQLVEVVREDFDADVFGSGWLRSDTSVAVDAANGLLTITSDGGNDDYAEFAVDLSLPVTVMTRMRLTSGGAGYLLPSMKVGYGATYTEAVHTTFLPGASYGWAFGPPPDFWSLEDTNAPATSDTWVTLTAEIGVDGGTLYSRLPGQVDDILVATSTWTIPSQITRIYFFQPWDAVCDFDFLSISQESTE